MFHYVGYQIYPICPIYDQVFLLVPITRIWNNAKMNIFRAKSLCTFMIIF